MTEALTLITPSSVSATGSASVSVTGNGTIVASNVTTDSISIEGIFSSSHHNYLLIFSSVLGAGALLGRLRVGGSDATGGDYDRENMDIFSTTVAGAEFVNETSGRLFNSSGSVYPSAAHVYMFGPNLAAETVWRSVTIYHDSDDPRIIDYAINHTVSTAYTGFTIFGSASTAFRLQVFGFNK